jgi:hypothetical protein
MDKRWPVRQAHQHVFPPRRIVVVGESVSPAKDIPQPKQTLMQKLRSLRMEGDSNAKR